MEVRALQPNEAFLFGDASGMLRSEWAAGTSRPAWSFLASENGKVVARLALRTVYRNDMSHEVRPFGLNAKLSTPQGLEAARALFRSAFEAAAAGGVTHFARVVEADWPEADEQCDLLRELGVPQLQTKLRFWREPKPKVAPAAERLTTRPFAEHTDEQLVSILAEIMDGSLDHVDTVNRSEMGRIGAAQHLLATVRDFDHEPAWFTVAHDAGGDPVGVSAPVRLGDYGCIGFIGVRPQHRGRGHINELLAGATRLLLDHKLPGVTADTDADNAPMAAAFTRAGYEPEAPARYFQVRLADLQRAG
jgi:RimJ/RimL family protein N-acetyltransferase